MINQNRVLKFSFSWCGFVLSLFMFQEGFAQTPVISNVHPNPVIGANQIQHFTIVGAGFASNCTATLRDLSNHEEFRNKPIRSYTTTNLVMMPNFTSLPAKWSVQVNNPDGHSSPEFFFSVDAPIIIPSITGVSPNPVPGINDEQYLIINGENFTIGASVILEDKRTHESFPISSIKLLTTRQIVIQPKLTTTPADWSVQVVNPSGTASGAFPFTVSYATQSIFKKLIQSPLFAWFTILFVALTAIPFIRIYFRSLRHEFRAEIATALATQRELFCRDLHDRIGADISGIGRVNETLKICLHEKMGLPDVEMQLERISLLVREAEGDIGDMIWVADPENDKLDRLAARLRKQIQERLETFSTYDIHFPISIPPCYVPAQAANQLLIVVKEILNNVVKHSGACHVAIHLCLQSGGIELSIHDNGRGLPESPKPDSGHGLKNIRKRIAEVGGTIQVQSGDNMGIKTSLFVPLPDHKDW